MDILLSLFSIYFFVLLGFSAKSFFPQNDDKTLVTLSVYFLQPVMIFWGLTRAKITPDLLEVCGWYWIATLIGLAIAIIIAPLFLQDAKERSIFTVAPLIGNTGNLGIPLGIAFFGEQSVFYMSMINLMNVFIVYTIGVYFYSRGNFSVKESLINIIKMPVMGFALIALMCNAYGFTWVPQIEKMLEMGAYTSMTVQLLIFGFYLKSVHLQTLSKPLLLGVHSMKFIILPLIGAFVLLFSPLSIYLKTLILFQLAVPLAVANVNLASLYECKPSEVTGLVLLTSLLFIPYISLFLSLLWYYSP